MKRPEPKMAIFVLIVSINDWYFKMIVSSRRIQPHAVNVRAPTIVEAGGTTRCTRWLRFYVSRVWAPVYIDWESHYSLDKLLCLYKYKSTTPLSALLLPVFLTPLPTLVITMLVEFIPLNDPALGWRANFTFFIQTFIRWFCVAAVMGIQWHCHMPELSPPMLPMTIVTFFQAAWVVGGIIALTEAVGVFPVPFSPFAVVPVFTTSGWVARVYWLRQRLWDTADPEQARAERAKLVKLLKLLGFCVQYIGTYTVSSTLFAQFPAGFQFIMVTMLQVIKVWVKRMEWTKAQLHWPRNDLAVVQVVSNSQLFHQLFTAACFQTSKSGPTLLLILLFGLLRDILSIRTIQMRQNSLIRVLAKSHSSNESSQQDLERLTTAWRAQMASKASASQIPMISSYASYHLQASEILRASRISGNKLSEISSGESEWLERLTQYYHCRELVLLRMYLDIFVSSLHLIVAGTMWNSRNAPYRGFLGSTDTSVLMFRMGPQIAVRCCSLSVLLWRLRGFTGHPDGLTQLSFVLRSNWLPLQSGCILVALSVFGFSMAHYGIDTTFKFAWFKSQRP